MHTASDSCQIVEIQKLDFFWLVRALPSLPFLTHTRQKFSCNVKFPIKKLYITSVSLSLLLFSIQQYMYIKGIGVQIKVSYT